MKNLKPGDTAPDFTLPSSTGSDVSLKDFRGKKVVLYFYPRDNTPGCTKQACEYRDLTASFDRKKTVVLGVSRDSLKSHEGFIEKYSLNFPLLADEQAKVHKAYGAWGKKNMYGKMVESAIRTTVVIDEEGKILSWEGKVTPEGDARKVLETL